MKITKKERDFLSYSIAVIGMVLAFQKNIFSEAVENIIFAFLITFCIFLIVLNFRDKSDLSDTTLKVQVDKETGKYLYWMDDELVDKEEAILLIMKVKDVKADIASDLLIKAEKQVEQNMKGK